MKIMTGLNKHHKAYPISDKAHGADPDGKYGQPIDITTFLRIRKWYLFAFACIAITIIMEQVLIQRHLNSQLSDPHLINMAGRQRAYSQILVKEVLLLRDVDTEREKTKIISEIRKTLLVWKTSHEDLQTGNPSLAPLFKEIEPYYSAMTKAVENVLGPLSDQEGMEDAISILLENEPHFLRSMDAIVDEFDRLAKEKLQSLKRKELLLLAFSLLILVLEILFIFGPLSIHIKKTIADLMRNKLKSEARAKEVQQLLTEKEKSLQELQELNFVIDNAALFASAQKGGSIVFISKKFLKLLGITEKQLNRTLSEILTTDEVQQEYLREVLKSNKKNGIRTEEIKITTVEGNHIWLDMSIVPMHRSSKKQNILILCSDITERKKNLLKVEQLTQQNFEDRMLQKKTQASQIVEGQEEERKRIAKDIH